MEEDYTAHSSGIGEDNRVEEGHCAVRNEDGRAYWGESARMAENTPTFEWSPAPREAGADTTRIVRNTGHTAAAANNGGMHAIFSVKALATSVLSVGAVATVTVAAIILSVVLNVVLLVATSTSLCFQLDINYSADDPPVAILTAEGYECSIPLDGDTCITFDNLTPDTQYTLRIVNSNGDIAFERNYRTLAEDPYHCEVWGEMERDALYVGVEFWDRLPEYYTVSVTDEGGKTLFSTDIVPHGEEFQSEPLYIEGIATDSPLFVVVRVGNRGVAATTIYPVSHDMVQLEDSYIAEDIIELRFWIEGALPAATMNGHPIELHDKGDGIYMLMAVNLTPDTSYTFQLTDDRGEPLWQGSYTTLATTANPVVTQTECAVDSTSLWVLYDIRPQGDYSATVDGQPYTLAVQDGGYVLRVEGLTPETTYAVQIVDSHNTVLFGTQYTTSPAPITLVVEEVEHSVDSNAIMVMLYINIEGTYYALLNENEEARFELSGPDDHDYYSLSVTDLEPETDYAVSVYDANDSMIYSAQYHTAASVDTVEVTVSNMELGVASLWLQLSFGVEDDYYATVGEQEYTLDGPDADGYYALLVNELSPATTYMVAIYSSAHVVVLSEAYTTLDEQNDTPEVSLVECTSDSMSISMLVSISVEGSYYAVLNDDNEYQLYGPDDHGYYQMEATDLAPATDYTIVLYDSNNTPIFETQYATGTMPQQEEVEVELVSTSIDSTSILLLLAINVEDSYHARLNDEYEYELSGPDGDGNYQLMATDLAPGVEYNIVIYNGESQEIYSIQCSTDHIEETPPFEVMSADVGENYITLVLVAAETGDYWAYVGEDECSIDLIGDMQYSVSVTDLEPNTTYTISITNGTETLFSENYTTQTYSGG